MAIQSGVYEEHYGEYVTQLSKVNLNTIKDTLGLLSDSEGLVLPFFNKKYLVTNSGFTDEAGNRPSYGEAFFLFKYILLCPDKPYFDEEWCAFQDFKKESHFTNVNFFKSDTEKLIESKFTGKLDDLNSACSGLGGTDIKTEISYDLSVKFDAFPRVSLLLLFNDGDEEFPAKGIVLFQRQAEYYLDPESLATTSAWLAKNLAKQIG